ncbi:uncharacterized protein [Coffea arabica]|uniref:Uncharacterized protein n=1 Tax=Coffea arabica TaxID=13443 RepID=A0ABM4V6X5_COFAR
MGEIQEDLSACPTFSSYSSDRLADIAARVTDEFKRQSDLTQENLSVLREDDDDDGGEDDFEFSLVRDSDDEPEVFYDGQTRPIFPIFDRHLLGNDGDTDAKQSSSDAVETEIRIPLRSLFIQDREECEPPSSSSSSEADEMDRIPPGSYCVWRPKIVESSPSWGKKKSHSTGSESKRWKLLDLLRRSNSDGKDGFVFLTPRHNRETTKIDKAQHPKAKQTSAAAAQAAKAGKKSKAKGGVASPSAHEAFYVRNRAIKQGDKKKSYLPYRRDLVGFFANVNAVGRTFPTF